MQLLKEKKHQHYIVIVVASLDYYYYLLTYIYSRRVIDVFPMQILYLNNNRKENAEK